MSGEHVQRATQPRVGSRLEALLFDVDGTLADTERHGHRVAFNRAFADFDLDWHWDERLYGELLEVPGGKERLHHYLSRVGAGRRERGTIASRIADIHACKTRYYAEILAQGSIGLRPGVRRLLHEARRQGVRLAIATTTTRENVAALIHCALGSDAMSWFEAVGAGDVVAAKKPAPDVYRYVLERMNLEPGDCIAFEDSEAGARAARGAGLVAVVTVTDYTRSQDFAHAAVVLEHLGEQGQPCRILSGAQSDCEIGARLARTGLFDMGVARMIHARGAPPPGPPANRSRPRET